MTQIKNFLCILAGIFTIILPLILNVYGIPFLIIGLLIYIFILKDFTKPKIVFLAIFGFAAFFNILAVPYMSDMENTGLDWLGEAIIYGFIYMIFRVIYLISGSILFILYSKKKLFKPVYILEIVLITGALFLLYSIPGIIKDRKIITITPTYDSLYSVEDFKNELISRALLMETGKLYGINEETKEKNHLIH